MQSKNKNQNILKLDLSKDTKYQKILKLIKLLQIFTPIKPLTEVEEKILTQFLTLDAKYTFFRFSKQARKLVLENLKDTDVTASYANMNNRLYAIKEKEWLYVDEDGQFALNHNVQNLLSKIENNDLALYIIIASDK